MGSTLFFFPHIIQGSPSLLAEALFLVFADGRKKRPLFSRQRTPGKEPLLAGNWVLLSLGSNSLYFVAARFKVVLS